ncbi:Hypothetical predicted protein [Prunus dulcis]|uniref:Uncharacterized protein n=1 Tax=Prunus dulcis TaxID=3755 RepID=A0A5E4FGG8_PRUDU|nr:Hypothetical predicted protein [Prunus dulcis]
MRVFLELEFCEERGDISLNQTCHTPGDFVSPPVVSFGRHPGLGVFLASNLGRGRLKFCRGSSHSKFGKDGCNKRAFREGPDISSARLVGVNREALASDLRAGVRPSPSVGFGGDLGAEELDFRVQPERSGSAL